MLDLPQRPVIPSVVFADEFGYAALRPLVRQGLLVRVREGAYAEPPVTEEPWRREAETALAHAVAVSGTLGCHHVFSHQTAALLHGCWVGQLDGRTHITQSTKPRDNDVLALRRHVAPVNESDVDEIGGLPVTSLERTIEDCARVLPPREGLGVADSGLRILARPDRFDREPGEVRLETIRQGMQDRLAEKKGWRGVVRARAVLAAADGFAESAGESRLRWVALSRGLPRPVCQLSVETDRGRYFLDFGWSADTDPRWFPAEVRALGEEYDGVEKYATDPGLARPDQPLFEEKLREDALRRQGVTVRRRVAQDLRNPEALADDMRRRFAPVAAATFVPVRGLLAPPRTSRPAHLPSR